MNKLRQNNEYTDVILQSGDLQIQCHRNVLAVASDYFKATLGNVREETSSASGQLLMEPEILSSIVDYIYTGEIELTADNVESLVKACDVLQLVTLKTVCESLLVKLLEPLNCVKFRKLAALCQLNELQRDASRTMKSEFKSVALTDEFKELSSTDLIECIKGDSVNVDDEDVVFEAVLGWTMHDLDNRKECLEEIMAYVRLPYCSRNYLRHVGDKEDMLTAKCFKYIHEAMAFQTDTVHQHEVSSRRTVPRNNSSMKSCLLVVGGVTNGDGKWTNYNHCHYHDVGKDRWQLMTELPQSTGRLYSVCRVEGGLLLTGGCKSKGRATNQCRLYDMATKKWETMPTLFTARYYHRSISLGDCVYVVGGVGVKPDDVLASVERLNLKRRQWSTLPDLPHAVFGSMVATYDNRVFVFGGQDAQRVRMCCSQVFDVARGNWSTVSDTPGMCSLGAAVTLNESIYVVGGDNRKCLKYDPASDIWKILSHPLYDHANAPAVVWRGSILVAGGGDGHRNTSSVIEAYHPNTDTWSVCSVPSLNANLACHCLFNVDLSGV